MAVGKLKKYSPPLFSLRFLSYLAIVSITVVFYNSITFYNKYGTDLFVKSLTIGQHLKLTLLMNLSLILQLLIPIFFFSGALLYRSLRSKGINVVNAIKKDALLIIPITGVLWIYAAYYDQSNSAKSYAMLWEVEELAPGEKLKEENIQHELFAAPDLTGLRNEIDTLAIRRDTYKSLHQKKQNSQESLDSIIHDYNWRIRRLNSKINMIHLNPFYLALSLIMGMLTGYLINFNRFLSSVLLLAIGYFWYFFELKLSHILISDSFRKEHFTLLMIFILVVLNSALLIIAYKHQPNKNRNEELI